MLPKVDYYRYIASREWALKKRSLRERSGGVCERCHNAPAQQSHHLTYERTGDELLEDLLDVCRPCHEWLSGGDFDPIEYSLKLGCLSASRG